MSKYKIIEADCISCGTCKEVCKFDAITEVKGTGYVGYRIDSARCFGCGTCKKECLNECIVETKECLCY